jgi:hypothetical protein
MTTENNKLLAEFMGGLFNKYSNKYGIGNAEYITIGKLNNVVKAINHYDVVELKYHSDWNWLMEVVEKIEDLGIDVHINTCVCRIVDVGEDRFEDIECFVNDDKKQAVYNACVEFVKWYNNSQLKNDRIS